MGAMKFEGTFDSEHTPLLYSNEKDTTSKYLICDVLHVD